jgi:hypothetical protein
MRTFIAVALSTTLLASAAFAADNLSPLPAGKPAGVKEAQIGQAGWILIGVGAVAAIAIGVASSSNGNPLGQQNNIAVTATTT